MSVALPLKALSARLHADQHALLTALRGRLPQTAAAALSQPNAELRPYATRLADTMARWRPDDAPEADAACELGRDLQVELAHHRVDLQTCLQTLHACREVLGEGLDEGRTLRHLTRFFDRLSLPLVTGPRSNSEGLVAEAGRRQRTLMEQLWVTRLLTDLTQEPLLALRADGAVLHANRAASHLGLVAGAPAPPWLMQAACPAAPRRHLAQTPEGQRWLVVQRHVEQPLTHAQLTMLRLEPAAAAADVGLLNSLLAHGHRLVGLFSADDLLTDASQALRELLAPTVPAGRPWALGELCHPHQDASLLIEGLATARELGAWSGACLLRDASGQPVSTAVTVSTLNGALPDADALLATFEDLRPLNVEQTGCLNVATHDGLTGLMNRPALEAMLKGTLARHARSGVPFAVAFMDLDGFKAVNDLHGHARGDAVLRQWAQRIQRQVRAGDLVSRYGGDEFVVVLDHLTAPSEAGAVVERLLAAAQRPFELGRQVHRLSTSVGLAVYPQDGDTVTDLLRAADTAMYAAKAAGRGRVVWFSDARSAADRRSAPRGG